MLSYVLYNETFKHKTQRLSQVNRFWANSYYPFVIVTQHIFIFNSFISFTSIFISHENKYFTPVGIRIHANTFVGCLPLLGAAFSLLYVLSVVLSVQVRFQRFARALVISQIERNAGKIRSRLMVWCGGGWDNCRFPLSIIQRVFFGGHQSERIAQSRTTRFALYGRRQCIQQGAKKLESAAGWDNNRKTSECMCFSIRHIGTQ